MASVPKFPGGLGLAHGAAGAEFVGKPRVITHLKGRGTAANPEGRFESTRHEAFDDGWARDDDASKPATEVTVERAKSIIARNDSPDIPFDQSINPYRGCEHGCVYCYARPTHGYLELSAGLDFETKLFVKTNAAELLRQELARPGYVASPIKLGANTDPYQPIERRHRITRAGDRGAGRSAGIRWPSSPRARWSSATSTCWPPMARAGPRPRVRVRHHARQRAERASSSRAPRRRIGASSDPRGWPQAGVPVGVFVAPVIPRVTDQRHGGDPRTSRARPGRVRAGYTLVRLPHEVKDLFRDGWPPTCRSASSM